MVDKVIREYLNGHKRLVVPTFGAFIRKDSDGTVVFVEFLRKDDDVLLSLLRQSCGLDRAGAAALLEWYVETVRNGSGRPGGYVIEGVGVMRRMENGSYDLEYNPQAVPVPAEEKAPEGEKISNSATPKELFPDIPEETDTPEKEAPHHAPAVPVSASVSAEPVKDSFDRQDRINRDSPGSGARDVLHSSDFPPETGQRPRTPAAPQKRKKGDPVMVIAIIAAIAAILAMLFGLLYSTNPPIEL